MHRLTRWAWWCESLLIGLILAPAAFAWEIARFETRVTIHADATATVTETIVADFGGESRHGIYRDIPIHSTDRAGQHFTLRLRVREVSDGAGHSWRYRLESASRYQRLRIGDPEQTVRGQQTYQLIYEVQRGAIRFFPDHDECYWNLTGNEWAVPMQQVYAEVDVPTSTSDLRAVAYVGSYGSTERLTTLDVQGDHVVFDSPRALGPYEGLTAAVAWEKGVVHPPSVSQVLRWWLEDNWVYGLPLLVLLVMLWLWDAKGRDPRPPRSQVVEYEIPDGLTPSEAGTLIDQRVNVRDITATVIDLAVRGYLTIAPQGTTLLGHVRDYQLLRAKPLRAETTLAPHEQLILQGLFGRFDQTGYEQRLLSDLDTKFSDDLPEIQGAIYDRLIERKYFDSNPEAVRTSYYLLSGCVGVGLWLLLQVSQPWHQLPWLPTALAAGLSALIIGLFAWIMPRRTLKGAETTDRIAGFLEFLRRTDQDRIRRLNDPGLFERCLPYALAFGVANQWTRVFEGIYTKPPSWYVGQWDSFSTRRLGYELDHATSAMGRTFTSMPRASGGSSGSWGGSGFGGGGFSGGGGGGGGGGAW